MIMPKDNLHTESYPGIALKGDLFSLKNKRTVTPGFIVNPKKAAQSSEFANALAWSFRDVFGHGLPVDNSSWGEYLRCHSCGEQRSIEDYYGAIEYQPLKNLEINTPGTSPCPTPHCTGNLELFYSQETLVNQLLSRLRNKTFCCSVALNAAEEVIGFCYGWVDSLLNIWQEHAHHFGVNHPTDEFFLEEVDTSTNGELSAETKVFFIAEIGISHPYRDATLAKELNRLMFDSIPVNMRKLPTVGLSQPDKLGYVMLENSGNIPVFSAGPEDMTLLTGTVEDNLELWSLPYGYYKNRCKPGIDRWRARLNSQKSGTKHLAQAS